MRGKGSFINKYRVLRWMYGGTLDMGGYYKKFAGGGLHTGDGATLDMSGYYKREALL